jgi:alkanesulfonate monooxygenase SsuD/methylene tetrahydromethanopterin reductase-like flavin-dependent oxidoreductase (luciferase family)
MRIGVKPGQWGWAFDELQASWEAAEAAGFHFISCFDHVTSQPAGLAAWDAPSLLLAMAGVTERLEVAVEVVNASLRHPFALAGQIAVAQAASGGRVRVGLGAGSFHLARFDHEAIGVEFPPHKERLARLAACCRVLPALWRGETVDDETLGLTRASLGPIGIEPPKLFVGGASDAVLQIAARYADGWQAPSEPDRFGELSARLNELCEMIGRSRPISSAVQIFISEIGLEHAGETAGRFAEQGASSLTFVLHEERSAGWVVRLGKALRDAGWLP